MSYLFISINPTLADNNVDAAGVAAECVGGAGEHAGHVAGGVQAAAGADVCSGQRREEDQEDPQPRC